MLARVLRGIGRAQLVLLALALCVALCEPQSRRYGDRLQIALPMIAWGCSALNRSGSEFAARFAGMFIVAHGSKRLLGDASINIRPSGSGHGFPSAHTAAAALGASSIVHDCLLGHPGVKAVVVIAAAYVGGSRIEANAHDIWQVLAGGLLGWGADRVLRLNRLQRARMGVFAARVGRRVRTAGSAIFGLGARPVRAVRCEIAVTAQGGAQPACQAGGGWVACIDGRAANAASHAARCGLPLRQLRAEWR
ncbi:MAG: phosphatase PAP2 family protein [Paracoccaceae bacterium]